MGVRTDNNFDALRLGFALGVAVFHIAVVSGVEAWVGAARALGPVAEISVQGFFVLSGYLVWASLERSTSLATYAEKRIRRLYPAYACVILACASIALLAVPEARSDLVGVARYLAVNLVFLNFLEPDLPGVFAGNPTTAVNGALWTLKIEVMFYVALPVLAWLWRRAPFWPIAAAIYCSAEAWRIGLGALSLDGATAQLAHQLPGQMSFFIAGIALHRLAPAIAARPGFWGAGGALLVAASFVPAAEPLRAAGLALAILWAAQHAPVRLAAARWGDVSYGAYITHFPIVQTLVAFGAFAAAPVFAGAGAIALTLAASVFLWRLVERPALRRDSFYRRSEARAPSTSAASAPSLRASIGDGEGR